MEAALLALDDCNIECEAMTQIISHILCRSEVPHQCFYGYAKERKGETTVVPHYWIQLEDGWIVDLRLRMWLGDTDDVPHGIFKTERIQYKGTPVHLEEMEASLMELLTDGKFSHVKTSMETTMDIDKETTLAHIKAGGWSVDQYLYGDPFSSHHVYIRDYRLDGNTKTSRKPSAYSFQQVVEVEKERAKQHQLHPLALRLFSIGQDVFPKIDGGGLSPEQLSHMLAMILWNDVIGKIQEKEQQAFGAILGGYIKATQTYAKWLSLANSGEALHMGLNIYPYSSSSARVRPFAMKPGKASMLGVEEVLHYTDLVRGQDKTQHPGWFRK